MNVSNVVKRKIIVYHTALRLVPSLVFDFKRIKIIGVKAVNKNIEIRPLYFVPAARPQKIPARIRWCFFLYSAHLKSCSSDAVENATNPRSTYTVIDNLMMMGMERKKHAPNVPHDLFNLCAR